MFDELYKKLRPIVSMQFIRLHEMNQQQTYKNKEKLATSKQNPYHHGDLM